ncbi:MAG: CARDB domain-containing protein, partial [Chloroflexota bacterium]
LAALATLLMLSTLASFAFAPWQRLPATGSQSTQAVILPRPGQGEVNGVDLLNAGQIPVDTFLPLMVNGDERALVVEEDAFCRFGVNFNTLGIGPHTALSSYDISSLGVGWYINYSSYPSAEIPEDIEHAPVIRLVGSEDGTSYSFFPGENALLSLATSNPGRIWFVSNEPDRIKFQDGVLPEIYANAYHEIYTLLKSADPTAQIYAGSIVQPTEVRIEYLDMVVESYENTYGTAMPVDGWSIHNFILNEASCEHYENNLNICWGADMPPGVDAVDGLRIGIDQHHDIELFKEQIVRFRGWMNENGYQGKPVYLSEYGVLLPDWYRPTVDFSPSRINEFMNESFDYILNERDELLGDPADDYRLIQRLSWYSVNDDYTVRSNPPITYPYQYNGYLFNPITFERSEMGDNYALYTNRLSHDIDFHTFSLEGRVAPTTVSVTTGLTVPITTPLPDSSSLFTVSLSAQVANSGNLSEDHETTVSFFQGDPQTGGQQIGEDQTVALIGCGTRANVDITWTDVPSGTYDIYVKVGQVGDEQVHAYTESNLSNNIFSRTITVTQVISPTLFR